MHLMIYVIFFIPRGAKPYDLRQLLLTHGHLILAPAANLNPVKFGWNSVDSVLMPSKCSVTLLVAARKNPL